MVIRLNLVVCGFALLFGRLYVGLHFQCFGFFFVFWVVLVFGFGFDVWVL